MPDILLATLNAKYPHASFGLRYLMANLGPLASRAGMMEFDINHRPLDIVERILSAGPKIVGLGVYIWNTAPTAQVAADLKRLRPGIVLVLGGPEVSYETEGQEVVGYADYVITGEADLAFADLCGRILAGRRPLQKVIGAELPEFGDGTTKARRHEEEGSGFGVQGSGKKLEVRSEKREGSLSVVSGPLSVAACADSSATDNGQRTTDSSRDSQLATRNLQLLLPYHLYTDEDIRNRVVYVEASRGCPFKCEFCLSSLDVPVRNVPIDEFLEAMQSLLDRGLLQFKFVDRTFNLNLKISKAILEFFLERLRPGLFLHFEMIPDRLPEALRELIAQFPAGALQFEVGIQTFNDEVAELISRRQDNAKVEENLRWLREKTGVHVHTDLIVGLPGEDVESFGRGFDRLIALRPQEIQVGILKRLRGIPIVRHDLEWGMVYSPHAPYEVLETKRVDFAMMQRMRRFARYWDLIGNSGNFVVSLAMLWGENEKLKDLREGGVKHEDMKHKEVGEGVGARSGASAFWRFMEVADRLFEKMGRNHGIALQDLAEFLFGHLTGELGLAPGRVAEAIWADYQRAGRSDRPGFLRAFIGDLPIPRRGKEGGVGMRRQARHRG